LSRRDISARTTGWKELERSPGDSKNYNTEPGLWGLRKIWKKKNKKEEEERCGTNDGFCVKILPKLRRTGSGRGACSK